MTGRKIFVGAAIGLCLAAAAAAAPRKPASSAAPPSEDRSAQQLMQNCDAHKFETVVTATVDGQPHQSKVKLCGKDGQSDADWIETLKDAIAKLNSDKGMNPSVRGQIVTAINAEIARLQIGQVEKPQSESEAALPPPRLRPVSAEPIDDEYSSLPPLPAAPPAPPHVIGPAALAMTTGTSRKAAVALPLASGPAPKLSFACYSPGDLGDAPCAEFDRDTMVTITADDNVGSGVLLRFARNGEERASIDLPDLRRGRSLRVALPSEVCAGVGDGRLDLELTRNGELLRSDGPYSLRC